MSGPIPTEVASAAAELAFQAEARASGLPIHQFTRRKCMERIQAAQAGAKPRQSLPARTWAAMSLRTRTVLVMLGAESDEDPRTIAAAPWESLSDADRVSIGACARALRGDLASASTLW